jgi:hypothetical protein
VTDAWNESAPVRRRRAETEHRNYGPPLVLTYDKVADRFMRVQYDPNFGRNREPGLLEKRDLLD